MPYFPPPGSGSGGGTPSPGSKEVRSSTDSAYSYMGTAPLNTAESAADWTITRIVLNVSPVTDGKASGAWTNRASLTYV